MRAAAAAVLVSLLLAGCAQEPAPPAVEPPASASSAAAPPEAPAPVPGDGRVEAAALLPLAIAWAEAWREDATLTVVSSKLGEHGLTMDERRFKRFPRAPIDGRDDLWGYQFVEPENGRTLVVRLRADGSLFGIAASNGAPPAAPAAARELTARETLWSEWLATSRIVGEMAADPKAVAWIGREVEFYGYEIGIGATSAGAIVSAGDGENPEREMLYRLYDLTAWASSAIPEPPAGPTSTPAPHLALAIAWARAWHPEAELHWVEGVVQDNGRDPPVPAPTVLDGRDRFWHYAFGGPPAHGMMVTISAEGQVVKVDAGDPETVPAAPLAVEPLDERAQRWEASLRSERVREALQGTPDAHAFLEGKVRSVRYAFGFGGERSTLYLVVDKGPEVKVALIDTATWTVLA